MNDLQGEWIIRTKDGGRTHGVAHLCESTIADRVVLNCGRQLPVETGRGEFEPVWGPADRCKQCS